jgi:predicted TIM-barrel fold metal-dependent hydrolase
MASSPSRRDSLKAFAAAALFAPFAQAITRVEFAVPSDACDCHTHIIGDAQHFEFFAGRTYTPPTALPQELAALHKALHIRRVVIVTPSVYGTDNAATLYGMNQLGAIARGVAVIDEKMPDRALDAMADAGVRGIRLNFATAGEIDTAVARRLITAAINRIRGRNWHLQLYLPATAIPAIKDLVFDSPVPVVFDHFGGIQAAHGPDQPGFADLVDLIRNGNAYVKFSGVYRAAAMAPDYPDIIPFAKGLIVANPDRVLWGTDWPHPDTTPSAHPSDVKPRLKIDDGRLFNQFAVWSPDPGLRRKILVDNPARLYGF